jgi:Concanavalin A-like lectin/glucanases superfamily
VASYGFEEATGTAVQDVSSRANHGTLAGARRTTAGKHGRALAFDGLDDDVTIPDSASLDLTTRMTLEAWVRPTAGGNVWRQALLKEVPGGLAYGLYTSNQQAKPAGFLRVGNDVGAASPSKLPLNAWTHLATTYDGSALRMYLNGTLVTKKSVSGSMQTSGRPLKIGGNAVWGEFFQGTIDDVRVYDRALSATDVKADMAAGA